jgi:hypothetical protein
LFFLHNLYLVHQHTTTNHKPQTTNHKPQTTTRPPTTHHNHACTYNFCNLYCNQDSRVTLVYSTLPLKKTRLKKYLPLRTPTPPPRCLRRHHSAALTPRPPLQRCPVRALPPRSPRRRCRRAATAVAASPPPMRCRANANAAGRDLNLRWLPFSQ